jgi:hypothetical protein
MPPDRICPGQRGCGPSADINALVGFLLPASLIGLGAQSLLSETVAIWYLGLTAATLALAFWMRGIPRLVGLLIIVAYARFVTGF